MSGFAAKLAAAGRKNAERQSVEQFLTTGYPPLDKRISNKYKGGGLPVGRIVEIFGPESSGKTAIATNVMKAAQDLGGLAIFKDHENSFDINLAEKLGLNTDPDFWVYNKPDSFEQSVDEVMHDVLMARGLALKDGAIVKTGPALFDESKPIVVVFDSLAAMVPQSALKAAAARNMNDNTALSRATSAHFPSLTKVAERTNTLIIFLNQIRTKLGVMYGDPTTSPGGDAPKFYASIRIKLGRTMLVNKATGETLGQQITCNVIKNKVNRPFLKCQWNYLFDKESGKGHFDVLGGIIDELVEVGKLEKAGAWITWDGKKWNSRKELLAHITDNKQISQLIDLLPEDYVPPAVEADDE